MWLVNVLTIIGLITVGFVWFLDNNVILVMLCSNEFDILGFVLNASTVRSIGMKFGRTHSNPQQDEL